MKASLLQSRLTRADRAPYRNASEGEKAQLAEAARQFESLFTKQLLEAMKTDTAGSAFQGMGSSGGLYDDMMHQAVAENMAKGNGAGIAGMLYESWTGDRTMPTQLTRQPSLQPGAMGMTPGAGALPADGVLGDVVNAGATAYRSHADDGLRPLHEMMPPTGLESVARPATAGWPQQDDGLRPLREMMPPTGLERAAQPAALRPTVTPVPAAHLGADDGRRPLRDMLPPTGLETSQLNPKKPQAEEPARANGGTPPGGSYGYQDINDQRGPLSHLGRTGRSAEGAGHRRTAVARYSEEGRG